MKTHTIVSLSIVAFMCVGAVFVAGVQLGRQAPQPEPVVEVEVAPPAKVAVPAPRQRVQYQAPPATLHVFGQSPNYNDIQAEQTRMENEQTWRRHHR